MAGSPVKRARIEQLDSLEETIFAKLEDGRSLQDIAFESGCSRPFLAKWLQRTPERSQRYDKARETAAHALADDIQSDAANTLKRAIEGKASKTEVAAAKLAGDTKRWLAGVWNGKYSENKANVAVNIDLGSSFLSVMRRGAPSVQSESSAHVPRVEDIGPRDEPRHEPKMVAYSEPDVIDVLDVAAPVDDDKQPVLVRHSDFTLFDE
ncbi:terminase small subunit-like protein [Paraburkholderia oxyphila]|uniref:terminase small subunit-like protein n=1 Tax=Paraburkholderia oxyphila TaxID=614212 RepID=UPI0012EE77CC|nr:hypothetical protein [Paraburkholderia oxyphila]